MTTSKKGRTKKSPLQASQKRIAKAEAIAKKSRRSAAQIALKREQIAAARRKIQGELDKLDEALRMLDMQMPPMSWGVDGQSRAFFHKGSVAGTIVEILTIRPATRGEIRRELDQRFPDDPIKENTLDTILLRLKNREFLVQTEPRGPYMLARKNKE